MMPRSSNHLFDFTFEKSHDEINAQARKKRDSLTVKIHERQQRVAKLREEYQIDDAALVQLLTAARQQAKAERFTYSTSNAPVSGGPRQMEEKTIGAGVVNHLLTENDYIESEKADVKKLDMIVRNLRPLPRHSANGVKFEEDSFHLSYEELEFLGF